MAEETKAAVPPIIEAPAIAEKMSEATTTPVAPMAEIIPPSHNAEDPTVTSLDNAVAASEPVDVETTEPVAIHIHPEKKVESTATKTSETPLTQLFAVLPQIIAEAKCYEMWGVELKSSMDIPTSIVLEKFLRANGKDVEKARVQLIEALKWRAKENPRKLLAEMEFDSALYGGLGFVTVYPKTESHEKEIVTWNVYGAVKDNKATFGDVEQFVKWRAALMELSVKELDLASATVPIPADGIDPYRMVQVHDYMNVSFLRMDPAVKAASKETIRIFSMAYPELLKEKFFVNVPVLMGWVFTAMKLFLAPETIKKFHPLAYGSSLAGECKGWGEELPVAYGGKGSAATEGMTPKYTTIKAMVEAGEAEK